MNSEQLRKKRAKKASSRKDKKYQGNFFVRKQIEEMDKAHKLLGVIKDWQKKSHEHQWTIMATKNPDGSFKHIGKVCNLCGKRKFKASYLIRKKIREIFCI